MQLSNFFLNDRQGKIISADNNYLEVTCTVQHLVVQRSTECILVVSEQERLKRQRSNEECGCARCGLLLR